MNILWKVGREGAIIMYVSHTVKVCEHLVEGRQ